jgi:hypothetical protein
MASILFLTLVKKEAGESGVPDPSQKTEAELKRYPVLRLMLSPVYSLI